MDPLTCKKDHVHSQFEVQYDKINLGIHKLGHSYMFKKLRIQ